MDVERADAAGERAAERPKGLFTGIDERLATELRPDEFGVGLSFRNGEGEVRLSGLKLCPMTVSRKCVSEFQRGLGCGFSVGVFARAWLDAVPDMAREGAKFKRAEGRDFLGGSGVLWGMLE